jgi:hypothetical protein
MHTQRLLLALVAVALGISLMAACGEEETPEQRVTRLRFNHEIYPVAAKTLYDADGNPTLLVDLQVANQGSEKLDNLTVLVKVLDPTGNVKMSERVTLDMSDVRPGVGARVSASLPGVELVDEDEVMVELESGLSPEELHALPEYGEVATLS